jgi:hypothetical protein
MDERLRATPWRDLGIGGHEVNPVPSMMTADESLYLYWLARCGYTGQGEIVDGGPLLGGSTMAMGEGLRLNPTVANKAGRIHSYDLFEYCDHPSHSRLFKRGHAPAAGDSLLPQFRSHVEPWSHSIRVYPGDILDYRWSGGPIEVLFIDLAKTWDIQHHLLREFFPHLIPGVSVVVQQDYFFFSCYWIHLVMEALHEYFRPAHVTDGPTLGFEMVKAVPPALLQFDYKSLPKHDAIQLMNRAAARFDGRRRLEVMSATIPLLLAYRDLTSAQAVLDEIRRAPEYGDATLQSIVDKAAEKVARATAHCQARVA